MLAFDGIQFLQMFRRCIFALCSFIYVVSCYFMILLLKEVVLEYAEKHSLGDLILSLGYIQHGANIFHISILLLSVNLSARVCEFMYVFMKHGT